MKKLFLAAIVALVPTVGLAEKAPSVMFGNPDPIYNESGRDSSEADRAAFCKDLRKQLDELKGKPQRRNAVYQRYQLECQQQ